MQKTIVVLDKCTGINGTVSAAAVEKSSLGDASPFVDELFTVLSTKARGGSTDGELLRNLFESAPDPESLEQVSKIIGAVSTNSKRLSSAIDEFEASLSQPSGTFVVVRNVGVKDAVKRIREIQQAHTKFQGML